jgi:hypothetical protein
VQVTIPYRRKSKAAEKSRRFAEYHDPPQRESGQVYVGRNGEGRRKKVTVQ